MNRITKTILSCPVCLRTCSSSRFAHRLSSWHYEKESSYLSICGCKTALCTHSGMQSCKSLTARYLCKNLYTTHHALAKDEDESRDPSLQLMISETPAIKHKTEHVIAGKGPPPEPPSECCMSGCANCVWIQYADEVKNYYQDGGERAREHIEKIENPSLKAFVKFEIGMN